MAGLPYWPAAREWPRNPPGKSLTFLAQFCFADSRDICGPLPGDLLLIFADTECPMHEEKKALRFEWVSLGESSLVEPADLPETEWKIAPCYGVIYRTFDYPDLESAHRLGTIEGTKIGGIPAWIHGSRWPLRRFLCSLGSVQPHFGQPYPYLNVPEPRQSFAGDEDENELMLGDAGSLFIFRGPFNTVRGTIQYY